MSFFASVEDSIKSHPILYSIGAVGVLIGGYFLFFRGGSSSSQPTTFSYSVGPSDAQIAAGTQQQIATQADQTAVSLANIAANSQNTLGQDALTLGLNNNNDALQLGINSNNTALSATNTNDAYAAQIAANAAAQSLSKTAIKQNTKLAAQNAADNTAEFLNQQNLTL